MGNNPAINSNVDINIMKRYDKGNFSGGIFAMIPMDRIEINPRV